MKIALLAPFEEPVPPIQYGGTERVVNTLAEELVSMGHDVTLYASGDSSTSARLIACAPKAIRRLPEAFDPITRQALNLQALARALQHMRENNGYDIIHNHFGWHPLLFRQFLKTPIVTTLHNSLDKYWMPTEHLMYNQLRDCPVISISNSQRRHSPKLNYVATIHHGIWPEHFEFNDKPGDYLAFLGRIHPHKAPEQAIKIAKKTGQKLVMIAKIDPQEKKYWENEIKPLIDGKQIVFLGERGHKDKVKLLKNARALLSPLHWDEPFGIVNIESLACGTPVITLRRGSIPEIIEQGKTGFMCKDFDEMAERVADLDKLDRRACRESVEKRFTARYMAENHLKLYEKLKRQHTI